MLQNKTEKTQQLCWPVCRRLFVLHMQCHGRWGKLKIQCHCQSNSAPMKEPNVKRNWKRPNSRSCRHTYHDIGDEREKPSINFMFNVSRKKVEKTTNKQSKTCSFLAKTKSGESCLLSKMKNLCIIWTEIPTFRLIAFYRNFYTIWYTHNNCIIFLNRSENDVLPYPTFSANTK